MKRRAKHQTIQEAINEVTQKTGRVVKSRLSPAAMERFRQLEGKVIALHARITQLEAEKTAVPKTDNGLDFLAQLVRDAIIQRAGGR